MNLHQRVMELVAAVLRERLAYAELVLVGRAELDVTDRAIWCVGYLQGAIAKACADLEEASRIPK